MGELKDDQEPRKRKRELAADHYESVNGFATYSEAITSSAPTSRSSGLPNTNEGDGHKPKKFRNEFAPCAQRLFEHSTTKGFFNKLKTDLQPILVKGMKEVSQLKPTSDVGLEMADSAYLLKLLNYSNPQLETAGKKAFNGAMLLQEGMSLIAKAQEILLSPAVFESSASED